jgi:Protein of unknown function (DUF998)
MIMTENMTENATQRISTPRADIPGAIPRAGDRTVTETTRALLACGLAAGPLFVVVALVQVLTRDGFDLSRHPLSLLSLGDLGWVQITNFVAAGLLTVAFAVGMRRALHPGRGGTWGPWLLGIYGLGLVAGGVFVTDPALGFPPGTPEGVPDTFSWHAIAHGVAPAVAFNAVIAACFVFTRRFAALGRRGWAAYSAATGAAAIALTWWPGQDGISVRLAVAVALTFAWETAVAARLRAELRAEL